MVREGPIINDNPYLQMIFDIEVLANEIVKIASLYRNKLLHLIDKYVKKFKESGIFSTTKNLDEESLEKYPRLKILSDPFFENLVRYQILVENPDFQRDSNKIIEEYLKDIGKALDKFYKKYLEILDGNLSEIEALEKTNVYLLFDRILEYSYTISKEDIGEKGRELLEEIKIGIAEEVKNPTIRRRIEDLIERYSRVEEDTIVLRAISKIAGYVKYITLSEEDFLDLLSPMGMFLKAYYKLNPGLVPIALKDPNIASFIYDALMWEKILLKNKNQQSKLL